MGIDSPGHVLRYISREFETIMGTKGFFVRVVPFLAAFTLGIFIASLFVSITPSWGNGGRGFGNRYHKMKRLRMENEQLRNEVLRLRNELESRDGSLHNPGHFDGFELKEDIFSNVPPVPVAPPPPARLAR